MDAHVLSINEFNMPKVYTGQTAEALHVIYLILLDKGKFQSHPDMGVGLRTRYRDLSGPMVLYNLEADIRSQVETYLPDIQITDLKITLNQNNELAIGIFINNGLLTLSYNPETNSLLVGEDANYILNDII